MNDRTESKMVETSRERLVGINLNFHKYTNPRHQNNSRNQSNQTKTYNQMPKFNSSWNSDSRTGSSSDASTGKPVNQRKKKHVNRKKKQGNWSASVVPMRNKCNDTSAVKKLPTDHVQRLTSHESAVCETGLTAFLTSPSAQLENFKRLIQLKKKHYQKYFYHHEDTTEYEVSEDSNWGWFVDPRDSF